MVVHRHSTIPFIFALHSLASQLIARLIPMRAFRINQIERDAFITNSKDFHLLHYFIENIDCKTGNERALVHSFILISLFHCVYSVVNVVPPSVFFFLRALLNTCESVEWNCANYTCNDDGSEAMSTRLKLYFL